MRTAGARFDSRLLNAPLPHAQPAPMRRSLAAALRSWGLAGTDAALSPLQDHPNPGAFAVAVLTGPNAQDKLAWTHAQALQWDGSDRLLAATSRLAGLRLRLAVKWADVCWWQPRPADMPWDCGALLLTPAALAALPSFRPRRPTLMWLDPPDETLLLDAVATLSGMQQHFRYAVRLLVLAPTVSPGLKAAGATELRW